METSLKERIEEVLVEEHNQQIVKNCIDILNILEMSYKWCLKLCGFKIYLKKYVQAYQQHHPELLRNQTEILLPLRSARCRQGNLRQTPQERSQLQPHLNWWLNQKNPQGHRQQRIWQNPHWNHQRHCQNRRTRQWRNCCPDHQWKSEGAWVS